MWQDWVFAAGNVFFIVSLLPSLCSKNKPHFWTSLPTAGILYIFAYTALSLDQVINCWVTCCSATMWLVLALQKFRSKT